MCCANKFDIYGIIRRQKDSNEQNTNNNQDSAMNRFAKGPSATRRAMRHTIRIGVLLLTCMLAACASLPNVSYLRDRDLTPKETPAIVGSHGKLSDAKAKALLQALRAKTGPTDMLARHLAAEQAILGKPLVAGNKVTLLDDGPETMRAMRAAIRAAHHNINLETYIFEDDEVGRALADLLIRKQADGVVVHLIYDSVGTIGTPREFFDRMRAAGIHTLEFNPVNPLRASGSWELNQRDHRKLLVVDGRIALTGGVNISKVYGKSSFLGKTSRHAQPDSDEAAWRDTHMQIEGPAVAERNFRNCSSTPGCARPAKRWPTRIIFRR